MTLEVAGYSRPPVVDRSTWNTFDREVARKSFASNVNLFKSAYRGALSGKNNSNSEITDLIFSTVDGLSKRLDGLHYVEDLPQSLTQIHDFVMEQVDKHYSGDPEMFLDRIEVHAMEATRAIVEGYMAGVPLAPEGEFTHLPDLQQNVHPRRGALHHDAMPLKNVESQPRIVRNARGDAFVQDPDGVQHREDNLVRVSGRNLAGAWNSPLPEGAFIDLRPLMRQIKRGEPGSLRGYTDNQGKRRPF